jgi:hypothetical protein
MNFQGNGEASERGSAPKKTIHILELPTETLDAIFAHVRKASLMCEDGLANLVLCRLDIPSSSIYASYPRNSGNMQWLSCIDNSTIHSMISKTVSGLF